jgi:hypothetical protein
MCKRVTEIAPASRRALKAPSARAATSISGQLTPIELHGPCPLSFGPRCCVCRVDIRLVCTRRYPPLSTALCCGAELLTAELVRCGPATADRPPRWRASSGPHLYKKRFLSPLSAAAISGGRRGAVVAPIGRLSDFTTAPGPGARCHDTISRLCSAPGRSSCRASLLAAIT